MQDDAAKGVLEWERRLAEAGARIEPVLREAVPQEAKDYVGDAIWYHLQTGGKRVRPAICLLTCEELGGDPNDALYFAAAVELLHNALLLHDDIEDGDRIRRDRPTVWVKYGVANAINVGDFMYGLANTLVLKSPVDDARLVRLVSNYAETLRATCAGQAYDLNLRGAEDLTTEDYLRIVTLKTGRYMALGMVGGAIIAGHDESVTGALQVVGERMGAAFQIRDDLLDLTAGKGRGGVIGNDIREGKPSILYAHVLTAAGGRQRERLLEIMGKPRSETTDEDVDYVRELYDELGCIAFAKKEAARLVEAAFESVDRVPVEGTAFLRGLVRYMVERKK